MLEWTGQDGAYRALRKARGKGWRAMSHSAKAQLLWAADALDWGWVQDLVAVSGAAQGSGRAARGAAEALLRQGDVLGWRWVRGLIHSQP